MLRFFRNTFEFTVLLLLIFCLSSRANPSEILADSTDTLEKLLTTESAYKCVTYHHNAYRLISRFLSEGKRDSLDMVVQFLHEKCSVVDLDNLPVLLKIKDGKLTNDYCDSVIVNDLLGRHLYWFDGTVVDYLSNWQSEVRRQFASALKTLAEQLVEETDTKSVGHLLSLYYTRKNDKIIDGLSGNQYSGTCFQTAYDARIDSLRDERNKFRSHFGFNFGVWLPQNKVQILGRKIEFGGQAGIRDGRWGADATLLLRALASKEPYTFGHNGTLRTTKHFFGMYAGLDPTFELYITNRTALELFAGVGYDNFEAMNGKGEDSSDYIQSLNVNFGATVYFFYNKYGNRYFGIQARYNLVHYYSHGTTDLRGNAISLNFVWGFLGNSWAAQELQRLENYK